MSGASMWLRRLPRFANRLQPKNTETLGPFTVGLFPSSSPHHLRSKKASIERPFAVSDRPPKGYIIDMQCLPYSCYFDENSRHLTVMLDFPAF
jgi:hypothetical protein